MLAPPSSIFNFNYVVDSWIFGGLFAMHVKEVKIIMVGSDLYMLRSQKHVKDLVR